jgi:alpha-2-macroglobulin-like protein
MKLSSIVLLPTALLACSDKPTVQPNPPGPPEVFENAAALVDETLIRAAIDGATAEVVVPVTKKDGDLLDGWLRVRLIDLSVKEEPTLADVTMTLDQRDEQVDYRVRLSGLPDNITRPNTAAVAIAWSVDTDDGMLFGSRSLYEALGKIEIQLRGATEMPIGESANLRAIVRDPNSGAPFVGARVKAELIVDQTATPLTEGTTDAEGELTLAIALPEGTDSGEVRVTVEHGDTTAWTSTTLRAVRERKLALSMDKTIYKPGHTIHLRARALHTTEKTPLAGEAIVFEALDAKGNKVFKRWSTTDQYGVASIDVPTDTRINEGDWTLRAEIDGARIEHKVPVVRYNLPKLKVSVRTEQTYAKPGDTVRGHVDARYLFGLPVANASVQVFGELPDGSQIASANGTTDAEGHLAFDLALGSYPLSEGSAPLTVKATVVDTAGQTELGSSSLVLTQAELVIRALGENKKLVPNVENRIFILVSDPLGQPLVASVDVTGAGPLAGQSTDSDGVVEFAVTPTDQPLALQITATDGAQRSHTQSVNFELDPTRILVRADRAIYRAGDTADVSVTTAVQAERVYLDVYRGAEGIDSRTLELSGGMASVQIPITEAMAGALSFDAFVLGTSGQTYSGTARALVAENDRLTVRMTSNAATFAPGESASIDISVTDPAGNPKVAALGLTTVDEAVFALGGDPQDDLHLFFSLDERVLPSSATALGRTAAALFGPDDDATKEKTARLLFAGVEARTVGLDYNSIRVEIPAVRDALKKKVSRDAYSVLVPLAPMAKNGVLTMQNAETIVEDAGNRKADAFGRPYRTEIGDEWSWLQVTFTSAGPDEAFDTPDDVALTFYYDWLFWGDPSLVDPEHLENGGGWGGELDADAAAGGPAPPPQAPGMNAEEKATGGGDAARVRSDFRETIYVDPTAITDSSGRATISFPLADSITTWRMSAQASSTDGLLGSARLGFRTFQKFFVDFSVPTKLTKGDVIELPAVVYNYLEEPQDVQVTLDPAPWMTILSGASQSVHLEPSEVRAVKFQIRADRAGDQSLTLRGSATDLADALVRTARVEPDGTPEQQSFSDQFEGTGTKTHVVTIPNDAIEGGTEVIFSLTPGFAAQAVQGLEGMIQEPNGCFEQTTSTAWPNTLVALYLDATGQMTPELEAQVLDVVTRGYQRLLTFESPTGGFNWWGDSEAGNRILSSIMLWHLKDLENLIEIDEQVKERTLSWLIAQQQADGHWASGDALHAGNEVLGTSDVRTTAFITWALAHTGWADGAVDSAGGWLKSNPPPAEDLYASALAMNALALADPNASATIDLLSRLDGLKESDAEGRVKWPTDAPSWTGAGGDTAAIETTGLVAYGLINARAQAENTNGALRFLVANKDAVGSWYNTQATMNALRALLAAASPQGSDATGDVVVTVNGTALQPIAVSPETGDVFQKFDITDRLVAGDNTISVAMTGTGKLSYQLARTAHRPSIAPANSPELALSVAWDQTSPAIGDSVTAQVTATYLGQGVRDQVLARIGRAPGFAPRTEDLDAIVTSGLASRYEVDESHVTLYLMGLAGQEARAMAIRFVPTLAATALAPASELYVYYEPTIRTEVAPVTFTVSP